MKTLMRMAMIPCLLLLAGCGGFRFIIDIVPSTHNLVETKVMGDEGGWRSQPKVALIDVTGVISDSSRSGLFGSSENPVGRFAEALKKASRDSRVKAVIVKINSPGGTVTASDLMYRELKHFKESTGKPVVILMGGIAASGGYYIACAGDEIIANPTTITGSIGVIMQTVNFSEGMKRIGIRADAITSGPNKKVGSPLEPMSAEHRELLQGIVNELYASFRGVVVENRTQLDPALVDEITDGRVVTGIRALELGLVDQLGDIRDAFATAKQRAGLTRATLVKYHRPTQHVGSPYAQSPVSPPQAGQIQLNLMQLNLGTPGMTDTAGFYYLWDPMVW